MVFVVGRSIVCLLADEAGRSIEQLLVNNVLPPSSA